MRSNALVAVTSGSKSIHVSLWVAQNTGASGVGSAGTPLRLHNTTPADVGPSYTVEMHGALPGAAAAIHWGHPYSAVDLGPAGAPGNSYYIGGLILSVPVVASASGSASFTTPLDASWIGFEFVFQALAVDLAANSLGVVTSNAVIAEVL